MRAVLVTRSAGYIGSHAVVNMRKNYNIMAVDDFSEGYLKAVIEQSLEKAILGDTDYFHNAFVKYPVDIAIHFAAYSYASKSAMLDNNFQNMVFLSTYTTDGELKSLPVELNSQSPIDSYGIKKSIIVNILNDYKSAYGVNNVFLRYWYCDAADSIEMEKH